MHSVGIHSALAIKRQRKRRDNQRKARERRYSIQSSESGDTHSPHGSTRRKFHPQKVHITDNNNLDTKVSPPGGEVLENLSIFSNRLAGKPGNEIGHQRAHRWVVVVTSIGMLHIGVVFVVFGIFLLGAGFFPDNLSNQPQQSWHLLVKQPTEQTGDNLISISHLLAGKGSWWNELICTGLFAVGLGIFLIILNCVISNREEQDLESYVQRQLTRSRSGHRLERDVETGGLTTRHHRKAMQIQKGAAERGLDDLSNSNVLLTPTSSEVVTPTTPSGGKHRMHAESRIENRTRVHGSGSAGTSFSNMNREWTTFRRCLVAH
uniref:Uncharacterized protein n=1 Tax=Anopheles albimanus TaxID=7167 RepID=A0A182F0X4_ANOAL